MNQSTYKKLRNRQVQLFAKTIKEKVFPLIPNYQDSNVFENLSAYQEFFKINLRGLWYSDGGAPFWDFFKFTLSEVKKYPLELAYLISICQTHAIALKQVLLNPENELEVALSLYNQYPSIKENIILYKKDIYNYGYRFSYGDDVDKIFYISYCKDLL